jgi:hypothetical protein
MTEKMLKNCPEEHEEMTHQEIVRMIEALVWLGMDDETIAAMIKAAVGAKG